MRDRGRHRKGGVEERAKGNSQGISPSHDRRLDRSCPPCIQRGETANLHYPHYPANVFVLVSFSSPCVGVYVENTGMYSSFHGGCASVAGLLQAGVAM